MPRRGFYWELGTGNCEPALCGVVRDRMLSLVRRSRSVQFLAGLTAIAVMPGLGEIFESAAHVVETGVGAHDGVEHDHDGDEHGDSEEHGCSGTFHLCGCCPRVSFAGPPALAAPIDPTAERVRLLTIPLPITEAHLRSPYRPPRNA